MKCFYHNDMDGKCAGAIVYNYWVRDKKRENAEFIEIDYKDNFPFEIIGKDEEVIIVDFSLQKDGDFEKLYEITKNICWIDHHKTAIEKHQLLNCRLSGIRDIKKSGCELAWEYFYTNKSVPQVIKLLGDYDMWNFNYGATTKYFQLGIKGYPCKPEWFSWRDLFINDNFTEKFIKEGIVITNYQNQVNLNLIKNFSFLTEFEGYKVIACNQGMTNSQLFDSYEGDYDLMMPFIFDGKQYKVSIYTKKDIDCSGLAKKYGGGGHKKAAGFQCKELPFKGDIK